MLSTDNFLGNMKLTDITSALKKTILKKKTIDL